MKWFFAIGSFVLMQAYVQYAMWESFCGQTISRAEKMLFVPFMATVLWCLAVMLLAIMFGVVHDFPTKRATNEKA